jgi:hypothetical protein
VCDPSKPTEAHIEKRSVGRHALTVVTLVLICLLYGSLPVFSQASASPVRETGTVSGVRRVLRGTILSTTRYSRIHDFDVYFSLRTGQETYCVDYETVVLDEIRDLANSEGKDLTVILDLRKNKVILYTPQDRKLKARIVRAKFCQPPTVTYSAFH